MALTPKEELFCLNYVKTLNKAKSAVAAGYSKKNARSIGYENSTKPHIVARIKEIREEIKEQLGIDDHSVLAELAALSYWNIKDFIGANNTIKDLSRMSKSKLKPVTGIKYRETSYTDTDGKLKKEIESEIKFVDKRAAVIDLGRHLGIFEKDNRQKIQKIKVTRK